VLVQIKVLDLVSQERASTEREDLLHTMEQRAEQGREEALRSQVREQQTSLRWQTIQYEAAILANKMLKINHT